VRTAFFGRDANWGRLIASAGAALAGESKLEADIFYEEVCLTSGGAAIEDPVDELRLEEIMAADEIAVTLDLHRGDSEYKIYFSDLTHEYVTINAEYTT
jgi:glutamate N-acetyltransferase/amino-acid N-acetyltransferase